MYEVVPEIHSGEEYGLGVYQTYALRAPSGYVVHDVTTYARAVERAWNWVMPLPFFCLEGLNMEPSVVLNHSPMSNT